MRIFVTRSIPQVGLDRLDAAGFDVDVWPNVMPPSRAILKESVKGCDGILSMLSDGIDAAVMDAAGPQLKVVSNYAVGFNNIDRRAAAARGIRVGNTPDVLTNATADLAFALLIGAARRLGEASRFVETDQWQTWSPLGFLGHDLMGKTLGIFGMGRIGQALARRCARGWDMRVLYCANSCKEDEIADYQAERVDFETLVSQSDFISAHAPLTDKTHQIFNAAAFDQMKSNAVFVNTARGGLVQQEHLYAALENGKIAAAGLDVTAPEPMRADAPLLRLKNCLVLPHIGSATYRSRQDMACIAAENLCLGLQGKPLRCEVPFVER